MATRSVAFNFDASFNYLPPLASFRILSQFNVNCTYVGGAGLAINPPSVQPDSNATKNCINRKNVGNRFERIEMINRRAGQIAIELMQSFGCL